MNALGIEPRTYGLKDRCPIILKGIDGKDLEQTQNPIVTPMDTKPQGLHQIIEAWAGLPDAIKSAIIALVEANQPVEEPPLGAVPLCRLNTWPRKPRANPKRIRR